MTYVLADGGTKYPPQLTANWHSDLPPFSYQHPTFNNPINFRKTKSSPPLHFFLIPETVLLVYTVEYIEEKTIGIPYREYGEDKTIAASISW